MITWTYDPLILRNAWFNASKLGAFPREYLIDFYGEMPDAVNAGQGSDRLVVGWAPRRRGVGRALDGARPDTDARRSARRRGGDRVGGHRRRTPQSSDDPARPAGC